MAGVPVVIDCTVDGMVNRFFPANQCIQRQLGQIGTSAVLTSAQFEFAAARLLPYRDQITSMTPNKTVKSMT